MSDAPDLTEAQRRRAVAWVLALTANTALAPGRYERQLLDRYQQGELSIDEVLALLETGVYHLLYRSRATTPPTEADLQHLLEHARKRNARDGLTGLLLYSDGRYVQVLEGAEDAVWAAYARIRRDPRHTQVVTLSEGLGPARHFPDWRMAHGNVARPAVARLLNAVLADEPFHGVPIDEPLLHHLLEALGVQAENALCEAA